MRLKLPHFVPSPSVVPDVASGVSLFSSYSRRAALALTVNAKAQAPALAPVPAITTAALANATKGIAYSQALAVDDGELPLSFTASDLPAGLSIDAATGEISGTPTSGGSTASVTITVTDAASRTDVLAANLRVLDSFTMTAAGLTDLVGGGGDITTKFSGGVLQVTPSPLHGVFDTLLPASGKYAVTIKVQTAKVLFVSLAFQSNQNLRRLGSYSASGENPVASDQSCILFLNATGAGPYAGATGDTLELQRQVGLDYTDVATYDTASFYNTGERRLTLHVDASGATPLVSVDLDDVEVIAQQDMGAGTYSYGRYLSIYCETTGSGSTPDATVLVNEITVAEVA